MIQETSENMSECDARMSGQKLTLSIIVPVDKEGEPFRQCLSSLARACPPPDEVLLISDGAGTGIELLAKEFGFRCIQNLSSLGPARARNMGALQARGDFLFFVDSDVTIPRDAVARIHLAFTNDPEISGVIGSYDDAPAAVNFLSQYKNLFHHYVHQHSNEEASTFWSGCGAIRRQVFLKLGGFDERYRRPCIEDIEFGYRMKKAGYRIQLIKTLQCKHLKRWGILSLLKSDLLDRALPWTELILRDRILINDLNLQLSNRISVALVFASLMLLVAGFMHPIFAVIALILFSAMLLVNFPFYRFFYTQRKLWFTIRAIPWHVIYSLCCGLGFVAGAVHALISTSWNARDK
jgi:glycosyltransferase involved in cell wall biosynthesis